MKALAKALFVISLAAAASFAQTVWKSGPTLDSSMKAFMNSIKTRDTAVFLRYISAEKGLRIMNTIDQGEAGNADRPMHDSTRTRTKLFADFQRKGEFYQDIFMPAEYGSNFHDAFAGKKWRSAEGNKFYFIDPETGKPTKAVYMKWEKLGGSWYVTEVGRYIS